MPGGPLSGITVVDLSRVLAGPYCTMMLADLGARVIKVERPDGDDARQMGPFIDGTSAYFASVNRGKESIVLDLLVPSDRSVFEALLDGADVLVENFRPGVLERLGYGWEKVAVRWPGLVLASVSGFGQTGPYSDRPSYDMVAQAMGGIMSITGPPGGDPVRVGSSIGDLAAALFCAVGVVSALFERRVSGVARHVDVSMLDSQVALLENAIVRYGASGVVPGPLGARHPSITPFGVFRAASGTRLVIAAGNDEIFGRLCRVLELADVARDERFSTNESRCLHEMELEGLLEAALAARPADEWLVVFEKARVPCSPINDVAAVLADPQVAARRMIITLDDSGSPGAGSPGSPGSPGAGSGSSSGSPGAESPGSPGAESPGSPDSGSAAIAGLRVAGNPIKLSGVEDPTTRPGAPGLDADRDTILAELGIHRRERAMATDVSASFEVTSWNEEPFDQRADGAKLTTATVTKSYSGDIEGDSVTEWLMAYAEDGSASFVGVERIDGTVGARRGTMVVRHVGSFEGGAATAELTVVAGCGTGELAQATGRGDFLADPAGKVQLELEFG
ncbi:MAG: CoA:oxalate CoA-transferase [Acidimicrobiaceae bacterium]|nr:CoA:oxalate CoA-transferase [Acidimicrobiaceae bacterium]